MINMARQTIRIRSGVARLSSDEPAWRVSSGLRSARASNARKTSKHWNSENTTEKKTKSKKIEHVKTRKIQEKLKNVQIVEPVVPHPPDSSPGHPRGGAWCNMVQQTNIDGRHDMPRRHATTASIIIRMAEDIEDIDGNDSAPQRTASCHVDSHRFTSHVRV